MTTATSYDGKLYLSCAETAKLVRAALKREFPGTKFSVRSDTYAGGASIRVRWTDGPTRPSVEKIAKRYSGADFDGMIDLKCYSDHWLEPDGTVVLAHTPGTESSRGYIPAATNDSPSPNAQLVSLGADYVFCDRDLSDEFTVELRREICEAADVYALDPSTGYEVAVIDGRAVRCLGREEYASTLVHQLSAERTR